MPLVFQLIYVPTRCILVFVVVLGTTFQKGPMYLQESITDVGSRRLLLKT